MKTFKNLLQRDASKYIFLTFTSLFFILSYHSYLAIILLVITLIYLFKKSKNLLIYTLIIILILGVRISIIKSRDISLPTEGRITEIGDNYLIIKNQGLIKVYVDDLEGFVPGYNILVKGYEIDSDGYQIHNTFDYSQYLRSNNISLVIYATDIEILDYNQSIYTIKYKIEEYITNKYNKETASYLKLFILGEKDEYYETNQTIIQSLGVAHLFAISGMHLGLLVAIFSFLLKKLFLTKETNQIIIVILLIIYNMITGFKISIIRASLLIAGLYFKDYYKILFTSTDVLSVAFIGFLIYNPYLIYNIGFQLSFLIAFSLILGSNLFQDDSYILKVIKITLLANLVSLPIIINMNRSIGLLFLFSNLIFIVFVTYLFLPASLILLVLPFIQPLYSSIIDTFEFLLKGLDRFNVLVEFSFSQSIYILAYWVVIYFLIIAKDRLKKLISLMILLTVFIMNIFVSCNSYSFVRFLDVSQGDSIHIHDGCCDMLIDTGDEDNYDTLVDYFKSYNIKDINNLVITHFHKDHYGELNELLSNFNISNLYLNQSVSGLDSYTILEEGDLLTCNNLKFQVISSNTFSSNENNNSIVLYADINNDSYLFTGDMEAEIEEEIIESYNFQVDILKVPHHGSITSSTLDFLEMINPEVSIIQVGLNNSYNQPNDEILYRYEAIQSRVYRTDNDGTISIYYYKLFKLRVIECYKHNTRSRYSFDFMK